MVESAKKTNEDLKRQKEGIEKQIEKYKARCETMRKIIKSGDERPKKRLKKVVEHVE